MAPPERSAPLSPGKRIAFSAVLVLVVVALCEAAGFIACRMLQNKLVFYRPERGDYAEYLRIHDPLLGWPARGEIAGHDAIGARVSPSHPDRAGAPPLVSTYGDSFTWSDEVGDADAWPEVLANRLGVRVDNFGVGGYGSDQALLRWRRNAAEGIDRAPVVVLAHLSENILRNVNQFRGLMGNGGLGFKPRFLLDPAGGLTTVPLPLPEPTEYDAFIADPGPFLEHETFAPGSAEGPRLVRFPYSIHALLSLFHPRFRAYFAGEPYYLHFYEPTHPAGGLALTATVLETFWREANGAGRIGVPVILPTGVDIQYYRDRGRWPYAPLVDELARRSVPVLDLGPVLEARTRGEPLSAFFADGVVSRHFNARGDRLVAEAVQGALEADPRFTARVAPGAGSP